MGAFFPGIRSIPQLLQPFKSHSEQSHHDIGCLPRSFGAPHLVPVTCVSGLYNWTLTQSSSAMRNNNSLCHALLNRHRDLEGLRTDLSSKEREDRQSGPFRNLLSPGSPLCCIVVPGGNNSWPAQPQLLGKILQKPFPSI